MIQRIAVWGFCLFAFSALLLQTVVIEFANIRSMQNGLYSDDHFSFMTKAIQIRDCPRGDCLAIQSARRFTDYAKDPRDPNLNRDKWREEHFIAHIYQPIYLLLLAKLSDFTGSIRSAFWLLYGAGGIFNILAIAALTISLFGPLTAGLALFVYSFSGEFFNVWASSVPWTWASTLFFLFAALYRQKQNWAIYLLPIFTLIGSGFHMMGIIFAVVFCLIIILESWPQLPPVRARVMIGLSALIVLAIVLGPSVLGFKNFQGGGLTPIFSLGYLKLIARALKSVGGSVAGATRCNFWVIVIFLPLTFWLHRRFSKLWDFPTRIVAVLALVLVASLFHQFDGYLLELFRRVFTVSWIFLIPLTITIVLQVDFRKINLWDGAALVSIGLVFFQQFNRPWRQISFADGYYAYSEPLISKKQSDLVSADQPCGTILFADQILVFNFLATPVIHCRVASDYFIDKSTYDKDVKALGVTYFLQINPLMKKEKDLLWLKGDQAKIVLSEPTKAFSLQLRGPLRRPVEVSIAIPQNGNIQVREEKFSGKKKFELGPLQKNTNIHIHTSEDVVLESIGLDESRFNFPWGRKVLLNLGKNSHNFEKLTTKIANSAIGEMNLIDDEGISMLFKPAK